MQRDQEQPLSPPLSFVMAADSDSKVESWNDDWKAGNCPWHEGKANVLLQKHIQDLTKGEPNLQIFLPLCGKSVDLLWLADMGHHVFGVECSREAIKSFFEENNLEHTTEATNLAPNGAYIHKAKEKKITIFECDMFSFSSDVAGRKFDAIWGRGAISALGSEELRTKYVEVISGLLAPAGRWMLETLDYNPADKLTGPESGPHKFSCEDAKHFLSDKFNFQLLEQVQVDGSKNEPGVPPFKHALCLFLVTLKTK